MHMLKPMKTAAWVGCVALLLTGCGNRVEELRLQGIDLVEKGKYKENCGDYCLSRIVFQHIFNGNVYNKKRKCGLYKGT